MPHETRADRTRTAKDDISLHVLVEHRPSIASCRQLSTAWLFLAALLQPIVEIEPANDTERKDADSDGEPDDCRCLTEALRLQASEANLVRPRCLLTAHRHQVRPDPAREPTARVERLPELDPHTHDLVRSPALAAADRSCRARLYHHARASREGAVANDCPGIELTPKVGRRQSGFRCCLSAFDELLLIDAACRQLRGRRNRCGCRPIRTGWCWRGAGCD